MSPLAAYLKKLGIAEFVIVDVGAKEKIECISGIEELSEVHAFEPHPTEFDLLQEKYSVHPFKQLYLHRKGLFECSGKRSFHVSNNTSMSSLLAPDLHNYNKHFGNYRKFKNWAAAISTNQTIDIDLTTIDEFFSLNKAIEFLKIDTQGSELSILKGAQSHLEKGLIKLIKIEVSTIATYEHQPLFSDIDLYLRNHHFTLVDFLTYRENSSFFFGQKHEIHFAPCGDAIYMFDGDLSDTELIKNAVIINQLGYTSLAQHQLKNTGLSEEERMSLIKHSRKKEGNKFKRALKDLLPPVVLKLLKKNYF